MKEKKIREFTASEITNYALKVLPFRHFVVWRSNNLAVKGRAFIGRKGVGDITGFEMYTGKRVECEVKKIGDTMKKDQIDFLTELHQNGGIALIAKQVGSEIVIENFIP